MVTKITNDVIADGAITFEKLANGAVSGTTISFAGQATGDLLYFNGSVWTRLPSGTSGQFLKTQGNLSPPVWSSTITSQAAANGYLEFPDGIKIQWGTTASILANSSLVVNFPSSFTTEVYNITLTPIGAIALTSSGDTSVANANVTAFTINHGGDAARTFYYKAIGK